MKIPKVTFLSCLGKNHGILHRTKNRKHLYLERMQKVVLKYQ